jgi:enterobactin synthetase component D
MDLLCFEYGAQGVHGMIDRDEHRQRSQPCSGQQGAPALPLWLTEHGMCARWMALDGGEMAALDVALPPQLARAVAKRKGEYRAGRRCAMEAIRDLAPDLPALTDTATDWPILGPDRAPVWPTGVTGSLTHCDRFVVCLTAKSRQYVGLGIDIEATVQPQDSLEIRSQIIRPEELALVSQTPWADAGFTLLFSAKESIFKAVYPTVKRFVDFHEARLTAISGDDLRFELQPELSSQLGRQSILQVRADWWQGHVMTLCVRPNMVECGESHSIEGR